MNTTVGPPLFLEDVGLSPQVSVRPLALLNILDHYSRRGAVQGRVIGTLLGVRNEAGICITNCFPVPHSENEEQVAVNMEFHTKLYELHRKVNQKEVILGWYATGSEINDYSLLIHEFYSNQVEEPVHLLLDTELADGDMSIKSYVSSEFGPPSADCRVGTVFKPVPTQVTYTQEEENTVDMLQRNTIKDDSVAPIFTDREHLKAALIDLHTMLNNVTKYVKKVLDGEIPKNSKIGHMLLDVVSTIPDFNSDRFEVLFNNNVQDLLMVMYLSNLTRSQLKIAEKLYTIQDLQS